MISVLTILALCIDHQRDGVQQCTRQAWAHCTNHNRCSAFMIIMIMLLDSQITQITNTIINVLNFVEHATLIDLQATKTDVHPQEKVPGQTDETRFFKFLIFSLDNCLKKYNGLFSWATAWLKGYRSGSNQKSNYQQRVKHFKHGQFSTIEQFQLSFRPTFPFSVLSTRASMCPRGFLSSSS